MSLIISDKIAEKLAKKHQVTVREVEQCFDNKCGSSLRDTRDRHKTNPPTVWFIAKTNANRLLKIIYVLENGDVYLKSAFDPDEDEKRYYEKHG